MMALRCSRKIVLAGTLLSLALASLRIAGAADVPGDRVGMDNEVQNPVESPVAALAVPRREIFRAIQSELARRKTPGRSELKAKDMFIQSTLPPALQGKHLEVKRIRFDPYRRALMFEIWAAGEPLIPPVEVTVPNRLGLRAAIQGNAAKPSATAAGHNPKLARREFRPPARRVFLTTPGTSATLVLFGENTRITLSVLPLQPGVKGQQILVWDPATSRVLKAEVVAQNTLEANF